MIYLRPVVTLQQAFVPRNLSALPEGEYVFALESTIDKTRIAIAPSNVTPAALHYVVSVEIPVEAPIGEYRYELTKGGELLACGLLVVGEYTIQRSQYFAGHEYEQYQE